MANPGEHVSAVASTGVYATPLERPNWVIAC
jgi:hypothetical protein